MKNNSSKRENGIIRKKIAEASGVPDEVILGVPVVTVTGCYEFIIMNYRGILEYTDSLVRIQTKVGQIKIIGKRLCMDYYTNDEMKISGRISNIEYIQGR